jgi:oxepin-CoA hydrolase/3-oxo-5,6-dehydrosuberyl-CoA semialdehyde dehydrogenase
VVPSALIDRAADEIADKLRDVVVGHPAVEGVRMGPVATKSQLDHVREGIERLRASGAVLLHGGSPIEPVGAPAGRGFFVAPSLLRATADVAAVHEREIFGPVATLLPHSGAAGDAAEIVARGRGGLVASIYSEDVNFIGRLVTAVAPYHGRLFLGSAKIAEASPGPGTVLPALVHGGPGHAGGGEELGGVRGLSFYRQRVALEGARGTIERITSS